jgi:agmatine/peptidylarginine deiminase
MEGTFRLPSLVALLVGGCQFQAASAMVLLTPPASHYRVYDEVRSALSDFYADFYRAGASVGDPVVFVADRRRSARDTGSLHELLARGVPAAHMFARRSAQLDDIWVRDFFATQLTNDTVAKFTYAPAYLDTEAVGWIDSAAERLLAYWDLPGLTRFDIVLDGGGIVFESVTGYAVLTDRVLRDNPRLAGRTGAGLGPFAPGPSYPADPYGILDGDVHGQFTAEELAAGELALETELGLTKVSIVPEEPDVPRLGHIDGIANWLAPGVLALSNFSDAATYAMYETHLLEKFGEDSRFQVVPFPYAPSLDTWTDGFESAEGIYVNFLRTGSAIYIPLFGLPEDATALRIAEAYGDRPVVGVNATAISIMGGSVRCLSQYLWGANADAVLARIAEETSPTSSAAATATLVSFGSTTLTMVAFGLMSSFYFS